MTVIRNNSISGINSITAQSNSLQFYDSAGNTLSIGASVSGNITGNVTGPGTSTFNGSVGIGTDNPGAPLDVVTNSSAEGIRVRGRSSDSIGSLYFYNHTSATPYGLVQGRSTDFRLGSESNTPVIFNVNGSEVARFNTSGNLAFPSGSGIDFSATGGPTNGTGGSELLDDYEEGTWTVGYSFSGGNGTSAITGSSASYTKIGRMVYVAFDIALSLGTASGNFTITGLPYARGGSSLRSGLHPTFLVTNTLTNALRLYISDSSTTVNLYDGTGTNAYNDTKMGSGSSFQLIAQGCYQIA